MQLFPTEQNQFSKWMDSFGLKNWNHIDVQPKDSLNQNISFSSSGYIQNQRDFIIHIFLKNQPYSEIIHKKY